MSTCGPLLAKARERRKLRRQGLLREGLPARSLGDRRPPPASAGDRPEEK